MKRGKSTTDFYADIINFELRHYDNVDFNYILSLPQHPYKPSRKMDMSKREYDYLYWEYVKAVKKMIELKYDNPSIEFQEGWLERYVIKSVEEYNEIKEYFNKTYKEYYGKRTSKKTIDENFSWFMLQYGLKYDFDYNLIK